MRLRTVASLARAPIALLLLSCAQEDGQEKAPPPSTPYGSQAEVQAYLVQIGPFVSEISEIHARWEQALGSHGEGTDQRRGTGRNLAAAAAHADPQMKQLLQRFDGVQPPSLLAPFHRDTRKLILLRLEAYAATQEGWLAEEEEREFQAPYDLAQGKVREANTLIQNLNTQMKQINEALRASEQEEQTAQGS